MKNSWTEIWNTLEDMDMEYSKIGMFLTFAAMIGVSSKDGQLNEQEKNLINNSFGKATNADITIFYKDIGKKVTDTDYEKLKLIVVAYPDIAMSYLKFILSFAYIDGKVDDNDMKKLEDAFAMILLADFFMSGEEDSDVDEPIDELYSDELTRRIVELFEDDDPLLTLEAIKQHFPEETEEAIQEKLSELCDEGYLYNMDTFAGNMYGKI